MADIVVTSDAEKIMVVFNDAASTVGYAQASWPKSAITRVELASDGSFVEVEMSDGTHWQVTHDGSIGSKVDTIDGATPSSVADLYTKIIALIKS